MPNSSRVRRCYVVKRPGFDIEAQGLLHDLRVNLGLTGLDRLRVWQRYDVAGLSDEQYQRARDIVFAEAPVDDVFDETADFNDPGQPEAAAQGSGQTVDSPCHVDQAPEPWLLAVEALPGQFDQRADSAAQCIQLLTGEDKPLVRTARVYVLFGQLSDGERGQIRSWLINPVEAREAAMEKPASLEDDLPPPLPVGRVDGFTAMDDTALDALRRSAGLAMSLADLQLTRGWFSRETRDPSWTEIRVLDTYWSDHCRHTTFLTQIESVSFPDDDPMSDRLRQTWQNYLARRETLYGEAGAAARPVCLMDLATLAMKLLRRDGKLDDLDVSDEINACSIKVDIPVDGKPETWLIQFKNETHNHPTEIEPFGGAATCLGGAIRDPLSGRAYVYQAMRVTGSGDPRVPVSETLPGRLPQRKISTTAAAGYSSYGNQVGLATGQVEEIYHPGYRAKRMEIGAVIGAVPAAQVRREQPEPGDVVILLGGRTGRDGCGGATGSSKAHDEQSMITCGSEVQKGNPPTERKIQRLFRDPAVSMLIRRCNDFGAGGVSVAIGELADGLRIDLDRVPRKYDGLDGTELAISESQERMAVVTAKTDAAALIAAADRENLEATIVAEVTAEPRMIMQWRGETIVDLSREFIETNGASQSADAIVRSPAQGRGWFSTVGAQQSKASFAASLKAGLSDLAACSRKGLVERFDSTIGAGTILMPFGGRHQLTPEEGMAARIPVEHGTTDATTLMTFGFDPMLSQWSPYHGAYFAVLESLVRLAALGGDPRSARLTFQEYFERLESQEQWGKPLSALLGAFQAQLDFAVPSIGGKDSMSGSFNDLHVPPTLVSFAVGLTSADQVVSAVLSQPGQPVWLLPVPLDQQQLPVAATYLEQLDQIARLRQSGHVAAQATVRRNGAAVAVARMCFGEQLGFTFDARQANTLFQPLIGSLLIALPAKAEQQSASALGHDGSIADWLDQLGAIRLGQTRPAADGFTLSDPDQPISFLVSDTRCDEADNCVSLADALDWWQQPLEDIFPTQPDQAAVVRAADQPEKAKSTPQASRRHGQLTLARPRVLIPVFPGTNTEYDAARAFDLAGAAPDVLVVRNLTAQAIEETVSEMTRRLDQAQILMLPGGFSAGDEPEGSGKFIAAFLRHPQLSDAVMRLLEQRDGLILGICNGFQALIKLGLLPGGQIRPLDRDHPTLTFNQIGRHVSTYVTTRVSSNRSPWLQFSEPGELHQVPVSHGEGRFVANSDQLAQLIRQDLIATQYVDLAGQPSQLTAYNPNGSVLAIEGITSPDGRILGKMGHSERCADPAAKNIPGRQQINLFRGGAAWFA